jgi:endonuclease I
MRSQAATTTLLIVLSVGAAAAQTDPFAPPPGYYDGATGAGALLQTQLGAAMTAGHIERTYGDYRFSARFTDTDPNDPTRILLVYNRASVSAGWDSGITWNREHVWPQSLQPGDASNSTRGNLGDPHALRPANPSINSSRGNKPFGFAETTGSFGSLGAYYFPGDTDKGDIARCLFYSETRYASLGLNLVESFPSGNQMGQLSALVAWHYLDPPDTFERRRNHNIFSQQANPAYYTNNRNAFVDMPEAVWSIFMDQNNNTTLWLGDAPATPDADGGSAVDLSINALVGQALAPATVTLNKDGQDGTYFSVSVDGPVTSSLTGRHNAFAIGGPDARAIEITPDPALSAAPGFSAAQIVVDNLDLTTGAGLGLGAQDADDVLSIAVNVYEPAVASFTTDQPLSDVLLDFGVIDLGSGDAVLALGLFNIAPDTFGAPMDLELVSAAGDTNAISIDFAPVMSLPAGEGELFTASLSDAADGEFEAFFTFAAYNDRGLFAQPGPAQTLILRLTGTVGAEACVPDLAAPFGVLNFFDVAAYLTLYTNQDPAADLTGDGLINFFDVSQYIALFNAGCP